MRGESCAENHGYETCPDGGFIAMPAMGFGAVGCGLRVAEQGREIAGVGGEAFGEAELSDVESFRFRDGADDRMKRFAFGERMDAVNAAGEFDDFVSGG